MEIELKEVKCLCGKDDVIPYTIIHLRDGKEARIVECRNCGLSYMNPRPDRDFLNWMYKEEYYASVIGDRDEWTEKTIQHENKRENVHLYRLKPIMKMGERYDYKKLLDIGTGSGYFLKLAKDRGFDVLGIEASERASQFANENYGVPVLNIAAVEEAGFEDRSFDVVTLCHVIEHLPYPQNTLKEIHRILRDNGILLVITPNYKTLITVLSRLNRRLGYPVKTLESDYELKTWEDGFYHLRPRETSNKGYTLYLLHNFYHLFFFNPMTLKELLLRCNYFIEEYPTGGYDYSAKGIRRLFSNQPINLIARIFNLQTEIMFYAKKA